ncbi:MAG: M20/M25/M40 family metallo-hydrolase [Sphaerochaetaceae bacterium]|nr:M20/M25/M40 family metallo-hydrolase [Sphaerochaetaceae bacterium]
MKTAALIICILLCPLLIALVRTVVIKLRFRGKKSTYRPVGDKKREEEYASKLSEMIKIDTVSHEGVDKPERIYEFHALLEKLFPLVHSNLEKTEINGNLLFKWKGKKSDKPVVLMGHQDVVPVEGEWKHGPFSGDIADSLVWGRGSADTKCTVMAFFQAVEELLKEGYTPYEDVYLSSSCTEEWTGPGCPSLVQYLKDRGVKPFLVCDEGGGIISKPLAGVNGDFAVMGIIEKGMSGVKFTAKSNGGHASAPKKNTPIPRLAAFVSRVEKKSPFKRVLIPELRSFFRELAPYSSFPLALVFSNLWLFGGLFTRLMPLISAQGAAMMGTTICFTMQSGSDAFNVIPAEASVTANIRFAKNQGREESLRIITELASRYGLETEVLRASDVTPSVDMNGEAFSLCRSVIKQTFPGVASVPYVMTGGTDARYYQEICDTCVRFAPVLYGPEQMKGMHGLNETISVSCLPGAVDFYRNIITAVGEKYGR